MHHDIDAEGVAVRRVVLRERIGEVVGAGFSLIIAPRVDAVAARSPVARGAVGAFLPPAGGAESASPTSVVVESRTIGRIRVFMKCSRVR